MEKKNNENTSKGKGKVVSCTASFCNIQPRVVLQRLPKEYIFGITSRSDNQPSTSGYLRPVNKSPEVDSSGSDDSNDGFINSGDNNLVTPSTSKASTSRNYFRPKEVTKFRVAPLRKADLSEIEQLRDRHKEESSSDCSFHSSPKEVVVVEENKTETEEEDEEEVEESEGEQRKPRQQREHTGCEECVDGNANKFDKPPTPVSISSLENFIRELGGSSPEENYIRELGRADSKVKKAISFLKILIDTYGRRVQSTIEIDRPPTPGLRESPVPVRRPVARSIVIRPQRNNLNDCLVRVWLSIRGQKKKKKFHVKLSQLVLLLKNKNHPLHKFHNTLNLRTLSFLSDNELRVMARVLSDFACAKRVKF